MEETTLLILAAGMGSRFGGLKQIDPIDDNGNFIIDYSIYDAIKVGFNKVVFIIKKENYEIFKQTIGNRISKYIKVDYAFQDLNSFVEMVPEGREKPWGTSHAVLCAKDKIKGNFAIINADDFYGLEAFETAYNFLQAVKNNKNYAIIAYQVGNTLTENGTVKRGVCEEQNGKLVKMTESIVERTPNGIVAKPLEGGEEFSLNSSSPVSMNFMCLNSKFFSYLQKDFENFVKNLKNPLKDECLIQNSMFNQIKDEGAVIEVVPTSAVWHGVTYKEDKPSLVESIKSLVEDGKYPKNLWNV